MKRGGIRNFEIGIYKKNLKWWHDGKRGELDHTRRRVGFRLCCPALWKIAPQGHENDLEFKRKVREEFRPIEFKVKENYISGLGCKRIILPICVKCAMPKLEK